MKDHLAELERIMQGQLDGHRQLLECIERNREAVRDADMTAIESNCKQEHGIAHTLGELEKARLAIVGRLTETLDPQAGAPLTLSQIAEAVQEPDGGRLLAVAGELRAAVAEVRRASSVVRGAAEALARHMGGLMQTVQGVLSRARVYGRRGNIATGSQKQFCVDVKS